ncbi:MAG: Cof-type HAD-IIB family hydrolase [Patescibacteria group bacterium]
MSPTKKKALPYRLAVIDLDETLVGPKMHVSPANRRAIQHIRRKGVHVTIATGRTFITAKPFADELGLKSPMICYNGGVVRTSKKIYQILKVPDGLVKSIVSEGDKAKVQMVVYINEQVYYQKPIDFWGKEYLNRIENVPEISLVNLGSFAFEEVPVKIMWIANTKKIIGLEKKAKNKWGKKLYITRTRPNLLEFMHPRATKAEGLKYVAKLWKIPLSKTLAIGDSYNDLTMLRTAAYSVAVKNAPRPVEQAADLVTDYYYRDGVAKALNEIFP